MGPVGLLRDALGRAVRRALWDVVPRDQRDTPAALRRRQWVVAATLAVGAVVLGVSLRLEPGSAWFYPATLTLAAVWVAGALASGPLHLGRIAWRSRTVRPVLTPVVLAVAMTGVFTLGALVVREVPWLAERVESVTEIADAGALPLVLAVTALNGVAEELFFRGAAYAAIPRHPVLWTTLLYGLTTLATGNAMLVLAALLLGAVVGLERRASGGILGPALTHVTWSGSMVFVLPALFA
ncbi:type II CAAX prenyl endopeptidase Rce1 family protein [Nocardioides ferulae]|uniref:CPBP family glutamic-type intramembrane protease n=1 Tax=Nocardioides ferulae TaxID=2340821 RepID=UPI001F0C3996|nr:CPBP family glutamic-type intramembrane protease [Nocardioides ferulae]